MVNQLINNHIIRSDDDLDLGVPGEAGRIGLRSSPHKHDYSQDGQVLLCGVPQFNDRYELIDKKHTFMSLLKRKTYTSLFVTKTYRLFQTTFIN